MNMPGFTADASLFNVKRIRKLEENYRMLQVFGTGQMSTHIVLQACKPSLDNPGRYCCKCVGFDLGCNCQIEYC